MRKVKRRGKGSQATSRGGGSSSDSNFSLHRPQYLDEEAYRQQQNQSGYERPSHSPYLDPDRPPRNDLSQAQFAHENIISNRPGRTRSGQEWGFRNESFPSRDQLEYADTFSERPGPSQSPYGGEGHLRDRQSSHRDWGVSRPRSSRPPNKPHRKIRNQQGTRSPAAEILYEDSVSERPGPSQSGRTTSQRESRGARLRNNRAGSRTRFVQPENTSGGPVLSMNPASEAGMEYPSDGLLMNSGVENRHFTDSSWETASSGNNNSNGSGSHAEDNREFPGRPQVQGVWSQTRQSFNAARIEPSSSAASGSSASGSGRYTNSDAEMELKMRILITSEAQHKDIIAFMLIVSLHPISHIQGSHFLLNLLWVMASFLN